MIRSPKAIKPAAGSPRLSGNWRIRCLSCKGNYSSRDRQGPPHLFLLPKDRVRYCEVVTKWRILQSLLRKIISSEKKKHYFVWFFWPASCRFAKPPYLCIVFFIVLDLRLTRLGYSGIPFFLPFSQKNPPAVGCSFRWKCVHLPEIHFSPWTS